MRIAVIMSVYDGDRLSFLKQSLSSIDQQTYSEFDVFIAVDGIVNVDIYNFLHEYSLHQNYNVFFYNENRGLAYRLNQLIDIVVERKEYEYVARMDADDVNEIERLERQVNFFCENNHVDVIGTDVIEITENGHELFYKRMDSDHDLIYSRIIKKCPFNHPTVMFKIKIFEDGFRYNSRLMNTQDYYLWVDLLSAGKKFSNINEPLVRFRINQSFHTRRGFKKAINDVKSRCYAFRKLNVYNLGNIIHVIKLFLLRVAPPSIKRWAYNNLR